MLANNYFCTLNAKIMKGILPTYCRTMGYTLLILCVFLPLMMFMFGMINDSNLLFTKASVKLLICKHSASCVFFSPLFLPTFVASL